MSDPTTDPATDPATGPAMSDDDHGAPVGGVVTTEAELRELYRTPSRLVQQKKRDRIDAASRAFIEAAPFLMIATCGADGGVDVSPRGGDPGFVHVLDDRHVAIPDLNGNNLIDSMRAVVATGRAGLLFVVPGLDETVRLNGRAWVTTDTAVLDRFAVHVRRPKAAVVVRADEVFVHCAKAFRRGRVWDAGAREALRTAPGLEQIVCAQGLVEAAPDVVRRDLEAGYAADLEADRP